ncbi:nuclear pore complex protein Nup155 [Bufo gargarizans]|uniref:nuclear pore complex protein Nup155 n=1 Tax=Bufo gargarizans TaxID=30331 RepID=UPI001CF4250D|nr:nuclear pore complex protein Nup155 [Bufo gargarizans]
MPSSAPGAPAATAAMQEAVEGAGRVIDRYLQEERAYPDLSDFLNIPAHMSFRRSKRSTVVFPNHEDLDALLAKEWRHPDRRLHLTKASDVPYPFSEDSVNLWTIPPLVDPQVARLAKATTLPLADAASLSDPADKRVDSLAKSVFIAAGAAIRPAFAASWVAKACAIWAKQLLRALPADSDQGGLAVLASQIYQASKFLCDASMESARRSGRAAANSVAIRRTIWLRSWAADSASKKALISLPFLGGKLFGKRLEELISEATGESERFRGFYSNLFTVPKKDGSLRPILDLKALNLFVRVRHFRMESLRSVIASLELGEFLSSIDIQDAYLHVPIALSHQRFLRFAVGSLHFQFVALPFGLASAPRVFTKVLAPLVALLRARGVALVPYLDDLLIRAPSPEDNLSSLSITLSALAQFGWLVNHSKSSLIPRQRMLFLGMLFDTRLGRVFLPPEKVSSLQAGVHLLRRPSSLTIRTCMRVLGRMVASFEAIPYSQFHSRDLQMFILSRWDKSPEGLDRLVRLPPQIRLDLSWWLLPRTVSLGQSFLPPSWRVITTDASLSGWGAVFESLTVQGLWSVQESSLQINVLELRAIFLALSHWTSRLRGLPIQIQTDNSTAVAYLNHQGGTRSVMALREASQILRWAEDHVPVLSAVHIPGVDNWAADFLSRQLVDPGEWSLHPEVFHQLCLRWGAPDVDLFASRLNHRLPRYVARSRDPQALAVDALVLPWSQFDLLYLFPPIPLLPRVLKRLKAARVPAILVAPDWPRRAWYADLVFLLADVPWRLPLRRDLLSQGPLFHPNLPQLRSPMPLNSPVAMPSFLATPAQGVYPPNVSTPMYSAATPAHQSAAPLSGVADVFFSGKHNGICIYFTRIVNNIWDGSMIVERNFKIENRDVTAIDSSFSPHVLQSVLEELKGLLEFLDRNSQFAAGSMGNPSSFGTPVNIHQRLGSIGRHEMGSSQQVQQELQRKYHTEAQLMEKTSLQGIHILVRKTCQALALWKLLCEHQFHHIVSDLQKELQEQLKMTTFKDLVTRDKELTGALVASLINHYIRDNASVDGISSRLQEVCPLFYSPNDAICSKANELLQRSRQAQSKFDKELMLRESLREYQKISQQVDLANVCGQYRQVRFYEGVVELCLTAAEKKDPKGLGLHFHKNGEPEEDTAGLQAFQERLNCYKCITDTLQELVNQSKAAPQSPSVPKKPGPPMLSSDPNMLSNEEAGLHFEQMLKLAQRSSDELFNIALFNWLIQADLTDKLLELNSPFLEPHLVRMSKIDQNKVRSMDLLWRYYEKNRNFSCAAKVVAELADMDSTDISLKQRIEYLSIAILSAKSSSGVSTLSDGEFLHELEEKMEVARIQLQIQGTLIRRYSNQPTTQNAVALLDSQLMDATRLYGDFADPFKLSECKLAIIHCAGHSDPILVQSLWEEIIERELNDSRGMNAAEQMQVLNLKLTSLGKIYASTPRYFPLEFLVKHLEKQVCNLNWNIGFVSQTMQEIDVSVPKLLEVYDHLFKERDPFWTRVKKPLHLLECIHVLLSGYAQDPNQVQRHERRLFNMVCLDAISLYLVELHSMEPTLAVQAAVGNFKSLQAKIERLGFN